MVKVQEKTTYSVKEVASKFQISEHTIRYYTDAGLIPNLKRDENNNRLFDEKAMEWLNVVICFRNCGMPIKSIKEYERLCLLGDSTIFDRYQIILDQKELALKAYQEAEKTLEFINHKVKYYEKVLEGEEKDCSNPYNS